MTDHYFSKQPHSKNVTATISCSLRNHIFTFTTGAGVFSKKGVDFGSKLLIESFEAPNVQGCFLDLGCGYGPIGISLAYSYKERIVVMADINERAVSLALHNAKQNDVENVKVLQSEGFSNLLNQSYATIITNPPIRAGKKVIYKLFEDSHRHLKRGGELWVVAQKKQGALSMIKYLTSIFESVDVVNRNKGYYVIRSRNIKS